MNTALQAAAVMATHDRLLAWPGWPQTQPAALDEGVWHWLQANHRNNSLLWAEEDLARRTTVADAEIAANKRAIDGYNQARNDATERVDELLLIALGLVDAASARTDAPVKLQRLQQQRQDLGACLDELLADAAAGRAYFKVYRQFKMYNDPRFNPALVKERQGS